VEQKTKHKQKHKKERVGISNRNRRGMQR